MNETPEPRPGAGTRTTTYVPARRTIRLTLPDGWARAILSGVEAALIAWALTTLAALGAYASVASNPWMGKASWDGALALGTDLLGVTLGAPFTIAEVSYTATPTLLTLLLILILRGLLVPSARFPAASHWFAVPGFAITALLIVGAGSYTRWWEALPGALLIPLLAAAWAFHAGADHPLQRWGVPEWAREGLRQGFRLTAILALLSLLALGTALGTHLDAIRGIHGLLLADSPLADVLIGLAQAAFAPTLAAWALAWLAGPGILIGVDALHSPASAPTAPIPAFPVLGALPTSTPGYWTVLIPILVGALAGAFFGIRRRREELAEQARVALVAIAFLGLLLAPWLASSVLHLGVERMAHLGPRPGTALAAILAEVGGAFLAAQLASHPRSREWARGQWRLSLLAPGQDPRELRTTNEEQTKAPAGDRAAVEDGAPDAGQAEDESRTVSEPASDPLPARFDEPAGESDAAGEDAADAESGVEVHGASTPAAADGHGPTGGPVPESAPEHGATADNERETDTGAGRETDTGVEHDATTATDEHAGTAAGTMAEEPAGTDRAPKPPTPVRADYWLTGTARPAIKSPGEQAADSDGLPPAKDPTTRIIDMPSTPTDSPGAP